MLAPYGDQEGQAYLPNSVQEFVLDWVDKIRAKRPEEYESIPILYLQGGNGAGKTRAVLAPVQEMLAEVPGLRVLWGRSDYKDLKLSSEQTFIETMPSDLIAGKNASYHYYDIIADEHGNTARIFFSGLSDLGGLGSQEFAVIVITEAHEITLQIFRALKRRCRQAHKHCMIIMESEPPNETHWLADITNPQSEEFDPDVEKKEVSTYENWANLSPSYRGSLESMPEMAKRKYLLGKTGFSVAGKPYYQGFNHQIHTGHYEAISGRPLLIGWDFGFHYPACVITQLDLQDRWIWLREIMGRDITIHKFADRVIEMLNTHYPKFRAKHMGDPAARQHSDKSEYTCQEILAQKGIDLITSFSTYRQRKEIIEGKLSTLAGTKPMLLVDSRYCKIAVDGLLGGYHYPEIKSQQQFEGKHELPYKDGFYEHILNAAEYIAVNTFEATEISNRKRYEDLTGLKAKQEFTNSDYDVLAINK